MQISEKNLLLINPWIYDFAAFDLWSKPLGLLYISSFLRNQGFSISYIDCLDSKAKLRRYGTGNFNREIIPNPESISHIPRHFARYGISEEEFLTKLDRIPDPDAILVTSIMTYWYYGVEKVVTLVRNKYPNIPVILGGIYATLMPEHAMKVIKPDYLISGPGEQKVLKLLQKILNLKQDSNFSSIDLDNYPYPAFDLYPNLDYLAIMTARGCPYDCSFCAQKKISMPFTQRNPDNVVKEIESHYQKFKIRDFAFYDDAIFINTDKHIKVILKKLIEKQLPLRLHSPNGLFARYIDSELADLMYKANFKTVRISFETSNEKRRKDMSNKISNEGMIKAVENLERAGYHREDLDAYVIMGLPDQYPEEILASIIFVNNLGVQVKLASYSPIPGTRDYDKSVKSGLLDPDIDPLLTNKTIFPLHNDSQDYELYRKIRIFSQILNTAATKGFQPFADVNFSPVIKKVIEGL